MLLLFFFAKAYGYISEFLRFGVYLGAERSEGVRLHGEPEVWTGRLRRGINHTAQLHVSTSCSSPLKMINCTS